MYFPQILQWFDDVAAPVAGALLQRWPSLQELQRAHPGTLKKFFLQHHGRSHKRIEERIQSIYQAVPARIFGPTEDPARKHCRVGSAD
jgi:hypothetical protein